jgi:hypothetical protein
MFAHLPPFMGWGDGDLRKHRNVLFLELLAASYACKKLWPRTPGMMDGYEALLQLLGDFGVEG